MLALLVIAFLVAAPLVAQASVAWVHGMAHHAQLQEEAGRRQAVDDAPTSQPGTGPVASVPGTQPRRTARGGEVTAPASATAVPDVMACAALDGLQIPGPPVACREVLAAISGVAVLATGLATAGMLSRRALDRHRMAAWEANWQATEPRWTARA
jgi:hypothetical protein